MKAPVTVKGLTIIKYTNPCSNHCCFCSVGKKRFDSIPFDRFTGIVERFLQWKEQSNLPLKIATAVMHSHALMSYEQSKIYRELCARGGYDPLGLQMNGCIFMPEDDLECIMENHLRAGYTAYTQTIAGYRDLHDKWVGRKGEFDFLMTMARVGARLGYTRQEQILLSQSSIPQLKELVNTLDSLPGLRERQIYPVTYIGWAKRIERERPDREAIRRVPAILNPWLYPENSDSPFCIANYKTEREWIDWVLLHYQDDEPRERFMMVRVDEGNLTWLESANCEEVYEQYLLRYNMMYNLLPEMTELCSRYGDRENERIYFLSELERKWVELYLDEVHLQDGCRDAVWF